MSLLLLALFSAAQSLLVPATSVEDQLAAAARIARERSEVAYSGADDSPWNRLYGQEKNVLRTANTLARTADEFLKVYDAAEGISAWDVCFETASRALAVLQNPDVRHYNAFARAARWARLLGKTEAERTDIGHRALQAAQKAVALTPTLENLLLLGQIQQVVGQHAEAYVNFGKAYKAKNPDVASQALDGLISTAQRLGRRREASDWFALLESSGRATDHDRIQRADFLYDNRDYVGAAPIYETVASRGNTAGYKFVHEMWTRAAFSRWLLNEDDAALASARRAIASNRSIGPESSLSSAHCIVAAILNKRGVYLQAIESARRAVALEPTRGWAYTELARGLNGLERATEAIAAAESAVSLTDGSDASAHFELGSAYFSQRKWSLAKRSYEQAAKLSPESSAAAFNVAVSLYNDQFFQEAIYWYEETLRREPKHPQGAQILRTISELKRR